METSANHLEIFNSAYQVRKRKHLGDSTHADELFYQSPSAWHQLMQTGSVNINQFETPLHHKCQDGTQPSMDHYLHSKSGHTCGTLTAIEQKYILGYFGSSSPLRKSVRDIFGSM
ncbi:hypothetical protein CEXT_740141 [Caerostris extrusa]|uniref:Uncharacterized protein n=1 Tax=Caerostris extrusa TaxID=172846 RepID=A0AAV4M5P2_CAEEX|nr:hypothetical protein CEXT_740141 [Caerostris extrusa]